MIHVNQYAGGYMLQNEQISVASYLKTANFLKMYRFQVTYYTYLLIYLHAQLYQSLFIRTIWSDLQDLRIHQHSYYYFLCFFPLH